MSCAKEVKPKHWTELEWASYQLAYHGNLSHQHNGKLVTGFTAIAAIIGRSAGSIQNEYNPDFHGNKLGLFDVALVEKETASHTVCDAYCNYLGGVFVKLPDPNMAHTNSELFKRFTSWQAKMGTTCNEIHAATDPNGDGGERITHGEVEKISSAAFAHIAELMALLTELQTQANGGGHS